MEGREGGGGTEEKHQKEPEISLLATNPALHLVVQSPSLDVSSPASLPNVPRLFQGNICVWCVLVRAAAPESAQWSSMGPPYEKAPGLLFFPGKVIHSLSQESGQAASYFSRALFLLFHTQRQHNLT